MRKRKAAQDEAVHDGELRRYAADPETKNEHGEKTKRFFLEQNAESDADILQERFKHDCYLLRSTGIQHSSGWDRVGTTGILPSIWPFHPTYCAASVARPVPAQLLARKPPAASKLTTSCESFPNRLSTLLGISRPGFGITNISYAMHEIRRADSRMWSEPAGLRCPRYNEPAVFESVMFSMITAGG